MTAAVSASLPSTLETLLTPPTIGLWEVIIGKSAPEQEPPFVACWPITPLRAGEALATEDWGQVYDRWQLNCFGASVGQCQWLRNQIVRLDSWEDAWQLVEVGPIIPDDVPVPAWWMCPLAVTDITIG